MFIENQFKFFVNISNDVKKLIIFDINDILEINVLFLFYLKYYDFEKTDLDEFYLILFFKNNNFNQLNLNLNNGIFILSKLFR
jgi:hypothetical protein